MKESSPSAGHFPCCLEVVDASGFAVWLSLSENSIGVISQSTFLL